MKKILIIYGLLIITSSAFGQTEKLINPADLKQKTVITEPLSLNKGFLRVGLLYQHSALDKWFDDSGKKIYLPESTWGSTNSLQLWTQYGITDRLMVEIGIPYSSDLTNIHRKFFFPEWDTLINYNASNRGKGLGDIVASATYQIIPSADNKFSMKAALDLTIPTGRKNCTNVISEDEYDGPTGYGVFCLTPRVTARMLIYPYSFMAYASYAYSFPGSRKLYPTDTVETNLRDGGFMLAGASINLHLNEWIALTNDISYSYWGKGYIKGASKSSLSTKWLVDYEPRVIFQIRRFRLGEAVDIPLKGKLVSSDPLYTLTVQYVF